MKHRQHRGQRSPHGQFNQDVHVGKHCGLNEFIRLHPEYRIGRFFESSTYHERQRKPVRNLLGVCCICGYANTKALEIHHIDENHQNNSWDNIAVVCANCHTLLTKGVMSFWDALSQKEKKTVNDTLHT